MSQQNVEIVRSILADWARGDFSSADWADPDIVFVLAGDPGESRGIEELGRRWREFLGAWKHFATPAERILDVDDDRVLVLLRFEGRGRSSGISTEGFLGGQLHTLRHGKVVRLVLFADRDAALEAAGLSDA